MEDGGGEKKTPDTFPRVSFDQDTYTHTDLT